MRIIPIDLVFRDGSLPATKAPGKHHFRISKGEDVKIFFTSFRQNGQIRNISGNTFEFGISKDQGGAIQIPGFPRLGTIESAEDGTSSVVINDGDTADLAPGLYWASLHVNDGEDWQPLPQSRLSLEASSALPGLPVTTPGPEMLIIGVPVPDSGDVGRLLQVESVNPIVLDWSQSPSSLPAFSSTGSALVQDSNTSAIFRRLTQDDLLPGFSIASFAGTGSFSATKELGDSIVNPSFSASYSSSPSSATIDDGSGALPLSSPFTLFAYTKTYTQSAINAVVTWTLTAVAAVTKTASVTAAWRPRAFFDVAVPGTINAAFIQALTGQALASAFARTITFGAGGGTKQLYYAFPSAFGAPASFKDAATGFAVPFSKVASAINVTNSFGVTVSYDVWASDNALVNSVTVQVS